MDTAEIAKYVVGGAASLLLGGGGVGVAAKLLVPVFAKARSDASTLGAADKLIQELQEEKKLLREEISAEKERHATEMKAERDRFEALRKIHDETLVELYKLREQFSELKNTNIKLTGEVESLKKQVRALQGVSDD